MTASPLRLRAMFILWPAFLMAGALEALVFVVVDPADLRWFGGPPVAWSAQAVYTLTFLMFWGIIATASAMTVLLALPEAEVNRLRGWPR